MKPFPAIFARVERKRFEQAPCSVARSLDVLGDWWTPLILRECLYGQHRFDDFIEWLGIGRNMLSRRLAWLVEQGVLEKRPYQERPVRYAYELTEKGYDACKVMLAMMPFGERWCFPPHRAPIVLYDRRTHARVRPVLTDAETGEEIDPRQLYAGPGATFPKPKALRRRRFPEYYERTDP